MRLHWPIVSKCRTLRGSRMTAPRRVLTVWIVSRISTEQPSDPMICVSQHEFKPGSLVATDQGLVRSRVVEKAEEVHLILIMSEWLSEATQDLVVEEPGEEEVGRSVASGVELLKQSLRSIEV